MLRDGCINVTRMRKHIIEFGRLWEHTYNL